MSLHDRLDERCNLPKDWDGYGALPPTRELADFALNTIAEPVERFGEPDICPRGDGGIDFEWNGGGWLSLDIGINRDNTVEALVTDAKEEHSIQYDGPLEEGLVHQLCDDFEKAAKDAFRYHLELALKAAEVTNRPRAKDAEDQ